MGLPALFAGGTDGLRKLQYTNIQTYIFIFIICLIINGILFSTYFKEIEPYVHALLANLSLFRYTITTKDTFYSSNLQETPWQKATQNDSANTGIEH
jgi:hypothetical protein